MVEMHSVALKATWDRKVLLEARDLGRVRLHKWVNGELIADMSRWDLELKSFLTLEEAKEKAFSRYEKEYDFSRQEMEDIYQSDKEKFLKENHLFTYESYISIVYITLYGADTYVDKKQIGDQNVVIFGHYGRR